MIRKMIIPILAMIVVFPIKSYAYSAESYCVIDCGSKRILEASNETKQLGMASTTKIITAYTALCNSNTEDIVTISKKAAYTEGSSLYLKEGETIKMIDLIYGLMLNSGNDAAVAIAEHISGSCEEFAKLMNNTAYQCGAYNTNFVNPNGLSDENHYTTSYDLALISAYALENEEFAKIVQTKKYTASTINTKRKLYFSNHNKLLNSYDGCVGVKTGFTKATGRCLVSSVKKDGWQAVCVTLNAPDDWNDHKQLFDNVFDKYSLKKVMDKNNIIKTLNFPNEANVEKGSLLEIACNEDVWLVMSEKDKVNINIEHITSELKVPVSKNDLVGSVEFFVNGQSVAKKISVACNEVKLAQKNSFSNQIKEMFCIWFGLGKFSLQE